MILSLALAAPFAYADAIPGATYIGAAADGASVYFTVSSDATRVTSYKIGDSKGSTCTFYGESQPGYWAGAPISGGVFDYNIYNSFYLHGSFTGQQSATGTFQFHNAAMGTTPACDTGVVTWTATTTATRPSPGSGGSGGSGKGQGNSGGGGASGKSASKFATRVVLRKLSARRVGGRVSSSLRACRSNRALILWRGSHRVGSTRAQVGGRYSFHLTAGLRGRRVRVTVLARSVAAGTCASGSSKSIRA